MNVDYIIVGLGLAGLAFSRTLTKHNKSFVVFEDQSQNSSLVAGGMYNPVVLKRFTPVWNADKQLLEALTFYKELEETFKKPYNYSIDIYRIFKSVQEQNNWFFMSDKPILSNYMLPEICHTKIEGVTTDFGYGKLTNTGRIDSETLLTNYRNYLLRENKLIPETFEYNALKIEESLIIYKDMTTSKVVFCEGYGVKQNPFFKELPLDGSKGELITIHAPDLNVDFLIKAAVFVLPLGNNYYKVGATFDWNDKTSHPTEQAKNELIKKLDSFLNVPYKIIDHKAGVRPTVIDRRPLVGKHPIYKNLAVLNGLGTRGIMIAPTMAKILYNHLEEDHPLDHEIGINRFSSSN